MSLLILSKKPYDITAQAYFNAVPNAFSAARKTIINTLIAGLRADGNLTKLDRLWLLANTTTGNAVIDVIGRNSATLVNSPAFTADQGYDFDGATQYIETNSVLNTLTQYTQNSASNIIYCRENTAFDGVDLGGTGAAGENNSSVFLRYSDGLLYSALNDLNAGTSVAVADSRGLFQISRSSSTQIDIYRNGSSILSTTDTSTGVAAVEQYIGAQNQNGTAANFSNRQIAIVALGSGTINASNLYTRIDAYMTSLGTAV